MTQKVDFVIDRVDGDRCMITPEKSKITHVYLTPTGRGYQMLVSTG